MLESYIYKLISILALSGSLIGCGVSATNQQIQLGVMSVLAQTPSPKLCIMAEAEAGLG